MGLVFPTAFPLGLKADNNLPLRSQPHLNPHTVTAEMLLQRSRNSPSIWTSRGYFTGKECNALPPRVSHTSPSPPSGDRRPPFLSQSRRVAAEGTVPPPCSHKAFSRRLQGGTWRRGTSLPPAGSHREMPAEPPASPATGWRLECPNYCVHGQIWAVLWVYLNSSYLG